MADSRVKIGFLVALNDGNLVEEESAPKLPIFEGGNVLGRSEFCVSDKRVSRKHVSLDAMEDGAATVIVEGSNPIVIRSRDQRKKLCSGESIRVEDGDVVELIPGHHYFKYVKLADDDENKSSPGTRKRSSIKGRAAEDDEELIKKKRQVADDEAFARKLQDEFITNSHAQKSALLSESSNHHQSTMEKAICHFSVSKDKQPFTFRLMRVKGLPAWANSSSVTISDVIQGDILFAVLSNYMVDVDWLISACPLLGRIPHVLLIHGESDNTLSHLQKSKFANWILHKPPLPISYGTHHSKAMFLVYARGLRVIIHTANLINVDWNNKSQGLWMQDFPWKDQKDLSRGCGFENDLIDYLSALKWPEFSINLPTIGDFKINPFFFKKFDYSSAAVRIIASVPGYHKGPNLKKWGHMKLRTVLQECVFDKEFQNAPLVYQFSSLGSLDEKWMEELAASMSSGFLEDKTPLGLGKALIIWPTVEDVRCSLEGYAAGNAIPSPQKNVEKIFLKKYWARWKATHTGRCHAMPHIKTFGRYNGQDLAWFLLTSSNLSKAAWGALQKNNSQLMIRSYELGVLFLPSSIRDKPVFSCTESGSWSENKCGSSSNGQDHRTKLVTLCWRGNNNQDLPSEVISLPVPYELPPQPYSSEDVPWSWDKQYSKADVYGQRWPRHVQLYTQDS
ncbi:hypothetical protein Syun_010193 [Stephania yunnanensis]|uniref:Tyrosyl-DNA phosphodiesterase 1 n=1 Tax=Stephania yunnanensis TaxID=152371 RepID=A0AAP0PRE9_9MAGN